MRGISAFIPKSLRFKRSYALSSIGAWVCFGIVLTMLNFLMGRRDMAEEMQGNLVLVLCCALGTHLVRMMIISAGEDATWRKISVHAFLVGVPLFSFLICILMMEITAIITPEKTINPNHSLVNVLFGLW
ncbi:MAG: hypothetical protein WC360_08650, partial [Opitutales bacterium]